MRDVIQGPYPTFLMTPWSLVDPSSLSRLFRQYQYSSTSEGDSHRRYDDHKIRERVYSSSQTRPGGAEDLAWFEGTVGRVGHQRALE